MPLDKLIVQQIEFADKILVNKIDRVNSTVLSQICNQVRALNPSADIHTIQHAQIDPCAVLNTSAFSFDKALTYGAWLSTPRNATAVSELEEYNISVVRYERYVPFHPARFYERMAAGIQGVLRSKGVVWFASSNRLAVQWSQAGGQQFSLSSSGPWFAESVESELKGVIEPSLIEELVKKEYNYSTGDRRQQLMLIGVNLNESSIHQALDACLLNDTEMNGGPPTWRKMEIDDDPVTSLLFPAAAAAAAESPQQPDEHGNNDVLEEAF